MCNSGVVFTFCFVYVLCKSLTAEDFGLVHWMCWNFSCQFKLLRTCGKTHTTRHFTIWSWHKQMCLLVCSPGAGKTDFQMWMCFLERLFHVVSEDAVRFCVILMNDCQFCCACVFFVCLYFALWIFGKITCISDVFSVRLYTTLHTTTLGDETRITKVCIVAVFSTNVHTADMHTRRDKLHACRHSLHTDAYKETCT